MRFGFIKNIIIAGCLIIVLMGSVNNVFSCSLVLQGMHEFDKKEYIFIGTVTGYTQLVESTKLRSPATGIVVKVKESVFLPKIPKSSFELFPINLGADCSNLGTSKNELETLYPLGSEIRVIAKQAKLLPQTSSSDIIRLERRPDDWSSIGINIENGKRVSDSVSIFDYGEFDSAPYPIDSTAFEIRKDLLRLKQAKTQTEKDEILQRLLNIPKPSRAAYEVDLQAIFEKYAESRSKADAFYAERLRLTDPALYNFSQVKEIVVLRLKELGFSNRLAERSFDEAVNEEMEEQGDGATEDFFLGLKSDDMFQRALTILLRGRVR